MKEDVVALVLAVLYPAVLQNLEQSERLSPGFIEGVGGFQEFSEAPIGG
jgi:hypothetical protein